MRTWIRASRPILWAAALKQSDQDRLNTYEIMLILEEKRGEVLSNGRVGYFIHDWQELRDLPSHFTQTFVK
jgi:hypothetical protein